MKQAYEDVTRWVRFNASLTLRELQLCNDGWIAPSVKLFIDRPAPHPEPPLGLLALLEEAASAVWLMHEEHEALFDRVRELFGPRSEMDLPEDLSAAFDGAASPEASLLVVRRSLTARVALLEAHPKDVDAHTRLVFQRHLTVVNRLILPALDAVAGDPAVPETDDLVAGYARFLPRGPRPHPDTFLTTALLHREQKRDHAGAHS
jgi:hypothetical protein